MLRPFCKINIGDNEFDFVTGCDLDSSWKEYTDKGRLTIPHRLKENGKVIFIGEDNFFNKGDSMTLSAGYYPKITKIFDGYVSKIIPSIPVTIEFEDAAYLLKQTNLTLSFESVTLSELMEAVLKEAIEKSTGYVKEGLKLIELDVVDAALGAFRLTNVNITNILEELKKTYALTSYFRGHTLHVGLAYTIEDRTRHVFRFQEDIIDDGANLEYLKEDDVLFKVKAVSMLENNKKIEIEVGDPNGEQRTITKYNLNEKDLREAAEREAENLRYEGFRGSIQVFFDPVVFHGDEIEIIDSLRPERNGVYLAESVAYTFGINGYFQEINLGAKVSVV